MDGLRQSSVLHRALSRPSSAFSSSDSTKTCGGPLYLLAIDRYLRDLEFSAHFPQATSASDCLYDVTLSDGHCKIRASLHPSLNRLAERNELRSGCQLRRVTFAPAAAETGGEGGCRGYHVVSLEVHREAGVAAGLAAFSAVQVDAIPWYGVEGDAQPRVAPLRARRCCYLPLWNNVGLRGEVWSKAPPSDSDDTPPPSWTRDLQPVALSKLRRAFFRGARPRPGALVVRVLRKSHLFHYGRPDKNCECPYQATLEVADATAQAAVVLWNSLCLDWYRSLEPGLVLRLRNYRVKESYSSRTGNSAEQGIEISLNSRNPAAAITVIPEEEQQRRWKLPALTFNFLNSELAGCQGDQRCDVIGLVTFVGRPERIRAKGHGTGEFLQYRWLTLEDGTGDHPITVQLFATSQPDLQALIYPMSLLVCTNLRVVQTAPGPSMLYLTNTKFTQVYGTGHHTGRPYRKLPAVKRFLQWVDTLRDEDILSQSAVGGYFTFPQLPAALEQFLKEGEGDAPVLSASELRREAERLQYRERRRFAFQGTVMAVGHSGVHGSSAALEESALSAEAMCASPCLVQTSPRSPPTALWSAQRSPEIPILPRFPRSSLVASCPAGGSLKRQLGDKRSDWELQRKRPARPSRTPLQRGQQAAPEADSGCTLWEATMEFLHDSEEDASYSTASTVVSSSGPKWSESSWAGARLGQSGIAMETLPLKCSYERREVQTAAVGLQPGRLQQTLPDEKLHTFATAACYEGHYTFTIADLGKAVALQTVFIPASPGNWHWPPLPESHDNSWPAVLAHGGFSPSSAPPAPRDLLATAGRLTNRRMVFVIDMCQLGGDRLELVLSRAFPLSTSL
ncbi:RPA-related protein RADX isoform X2 [Lepisosteus oculatus]|uniref:RPA-related protein RADX isoform X2 n=1 Tax=Lepisosteus oculatus TaxID=7918 RepID=UPI0037223533